jgi:hypothetical protein
VLVTLSRAGALTVCAVILAACGSKPKTDEGGFTVPERNDAQAALDQLRGTSIPREVLAISTRAGQAPNTCTLIPTNGTRGPYTLVVAWGPPLPAYQSVPQSLLVATIGGESRAVRSHVTLFGGRLGEPAAVKATIARAALAKPAEPCQALDGGELQIVPSG